MYRTLFGILSVFAAALLVVGLTFSASVEEEAEFRFHNYSEPQTIDPHLATGHPEGQLIRALFEGLARIDARTLRPVPGSAESWTTSADGRTYTFRIRRAARWSDGHPVTAHDFVYSIRRLLDPALGAEYAYIAYPILHAEAFNTFEGHADAVARKIAPGLAKLRSENPRGIDAKTWQRFLSDIGAHDPLRHVPLDEVSNLLDRRHGTVDPDELRTFEAALPKGSAALRAGAEEAERHLGTDQGVYATDDYTLVIELKAPTPYFLELLAYYPFCPVPRWLTEDPDRKQDWFLPRHIVGNGPFALERWIVNDHIRLERSETYWGKDEVRLRSVDAVVIEKEAPSLSLYLNGELDWLEKYFPNELVDELKTRPDFHAESYLGVYFYRINNTRPPLDDKRVRQALNLAIDRQMIVREVTRLGETPATTIVPPGLPGYVPPESAITQDVPRARDLLAEAGFPNGKGFPKIGILYNTYEAHKKIAEVIADQLRRTLNIEVTAYNQEWQAYQMTTRNLDYDLARYGWIGDYADPNTFLDMWITNGGNNQTGFSSPLYDQLIRAASDVTEFMAAPEVLMGRLKDPARARQSLAAIEAAKSPAARVEALARLRLDLLREAEAVLVQDEFPILPIYFYVAAHLVKPHVRGFYTRVEVDDGTTRPNLQDIHPLRDVWIDHDAKRGSR